MQGEGGYFACVGAEGFPEAVLGAEEEGGGGVCFLQDLGAGVDGEEVGDEG